MEKKIVTRPGSRKGSGGTLIDAPNTPCLEWDGNRNAAGYGRLWVDYATGRKQKYAHRVAWEAYFGGIPSGMEIDHLCVNPGCYRIDHLELVTRAENQRRVNRRVLRCPKGHDYAPENTYVTSAGLRSCRTCHRDKERLRRRTSTAWSPIPYGIRRHAAFSDALELRSQGYSYRRIEEITGISEASVGGFFRKIESKNQSREETE